MTAGTAAPLPFLRRKRRHTILVGRARRERRWREKPKTTFDPKDIPGHRESRSDRVRLCAECRCLPQASPADAVFYIRKGRVKLVVASKQGKEAVVAVLGAGEFFGEGCPDRPAGRLATARAMSKARSCGSARPR